MLDIKQLNTTFTNDLIDILEEGIKNESLKLVKWHIFKGVYNPNQEKCTKYTITIDSKDELSYYNKDKLRYKLSSSVEKSCQLAKNMLSIGVNNNNNAHDVVCQTFKLDRAYVV